MRIDDNAAHTDDVCVRIQAGVHAGAEGSLTSGEITVIGSAPDCDLQLADAGIAAHHLAIGANGHQFVVRPLDSECSVNGKRVSAGQSMPIRCGDRVALHDNGVWLKLSRPTSVGEAGRGCGSEEQSRVPPRRWRWTLPAALVLVAVGVVFGAQQVLSNDSTTPDAATSVDLLLESLGIAADVTASTHAGVLTLRGVLSDAAVAELEQALRSVPHDVANRTQSVSRLLEQVSSVFRANGYQAELTFLGGAAVQVNNLDGENPKIQQIAAHARHDVAVLESLTFAPVSDAGRSDRRLAIYATDPDKRLTTIVDGDTAYVATTDGGRYFIGSVLPGGLVLRDINADGIQVDDDGEIHWLAL